ncbi:PREDICTED: putative disease resistance protein At4g10780 [Camelina sativa]|uniref:Disease resistance protein At4g10780 n=1 Tax=Camelina sativa TaxID=90675 RepID=A0ABM0WU34_CAMSA|nr:PREDICTED: putative disease resistance protein At4g10780 [Camelina sativa]XP_010476183.1 PREDICTED: putative disease resistance protein At4g10780 [Camelina sativa]
MGGCVSFQLSCDQVLNRAGSCFCGRGNYIRNLEKNLVALEKSMEVLKARREDVLRRVLREEGKGLQRLNEVQVWLTSVQTIENHFDDLSSSKTVELQRLCLFGVCSKNLTSSFQYGRRVFLMLKEVESIKSDGVFEVVADSVMADVVEERPLQPMIFGRETMLERAWNRLMDDETGVMGLYGMGGVGKTTLLAQINNKFCGVSVRVDIVIWIVVSSDLRVEKIQDEIAEKLGLSGGCWNQKEKRQKVTDIHTHMKNKKFVLLLDDIWRKVDLTEIGVPFPTRENGCKVVFTTRSREVCGHMGVDDPMEVECLAKHDAWDLFKKKVGQLTLKSHPDITEQARKVAEKCCGLPLALNVIGETMSCKRTIQEWYHAVQVLNSYAADFSGMDDQILPILKYSYDSLKGDQIKSCFLYCSLFPEDYLMRKEKLIDYWICEGFISEKEGRERTLNQGYEIIGTLVRACLLLEEGRNKSKVKMHDVVREMALWISSDLGENREKCIVRAGVGLCKVPEVENWRAVERMSLMNNKIEEISGSPKCPKLTTLFLQENIPLTSIAGKFFMCMPKLVVLDLSKNLRLDGLPDEISELVSLKYLDLSRTLIVRLPACLQKLKKLMHLYLEGTTSLRSIDGISNLSRLRTLTLRYCNKLLFDGRLKELLLLKRLEVLTIEIKSRSVLETLFFSGMLWRCIQKVVIKDIWDESIDLLTFPTNLRSPSSPYFPNLSSVSIERCSGLKDLTWLLFAPNLLHLEVKSLGRLEEVVSKEKTDKQQQLQGIVPFGKLETLVMLDLPVVESIYWTPLLFPCLREMYIELCPKLGKLPLDSKSVAEVEGFVIKCEATDWIEGIEWEDEATRLRFLPTRKMVVGYCY